MTENKLRPRSDVQVARKMYHLLGVLTIVFIFSRLSLTSSLQWIAFLTLISASVDVLRLQYSSVNRFVIRVMGFLMRDYERNHFSGNTYLALGLFLIILVFPKPIVSLSMFFLAIADPLASYVGIHYGKDKLLGKKTLQGSLAAFVSCTLISIIFFTVHNLMTERLLVVSLLSGLIGAASELIPIRNWDDNFTFPIISSSLLYLLFYIFGGLI